MKIVLLTPGTGSYHCGVCMRDNALAKELIRQGHDALMVPCYLPLQLDEAPVSSDIPTFFGGVNVFLRQYSVLFRHLPAWLDRLLDNAALLRWVGRRQPSESDSRVGRITCAMLAGEEGEQRQEIARLITWLKEHGAEAVWISTALMIGVARQIKKELRIPVLASLQGEDTFLDRLPRPWDLRSWEMLATRARDVDRFIAPSRFYAKLMSGRMRLPASQVQVISNGLATDEYGEPSAAPMPPVIGFLARMLKDKGLGFLIDAFLLLKKRPGFEKVRLRVAGAMTGADERYVAQLRKKIAAAGWAADVEFLPNVERAEKIAFLKGLTLLTVPALYPEAFGLYIIEAWAAGVPVVQPRRAAFTELVENTGAGRLYEETADELIAEWAPLLADPALARELGALGWKATRDGEFSLSQMAERFLATTREVLEQSRPVAAAHP